MSTANGIVNELMARDRMLGTLAKEAEECSEENKNMAALACLFILTEQAVKFALEETEGNFRKCLENAKDKNLISEEEFLLMDSLRETRNKLFHEYHHALLWEEEGISYPCSENESRKKIYDTFSERCFEIALRLVS